MREIRTSGLMSGDGKRVLCYNRARPRLYPKNAGRSRRRSLLHSKTTPKRATNTTCCAPCRESEKSLQRLCSLTCPSSVRSTDIRWRAWLDLLLIPSKAECPERRLISGADEAASGRPCTWPQSARFAAILHSKPFTAGWSKPESLEKLQSSPSHGSLQSWPTRSSRPMSLGTQRLRLTDNTVTGSRYACPAMTMGGRWRLRFPRRPAFPRIALRLSGASAASYGKARARRMGSLTPDPLAILAGNDTG